MARRLSAQRPDRGGRPGPFDGALFEMEHGPYDIRALQGAPDMLDPREIAQRGVAPAVTPMVRIPPNAGETNWIAKQVSISASTGLSGPTSIP